MKNLDKKGYLLITSSLIIWSIAIPLIKLGLNSEKEWPFLFWRLILASFFIALTGIFKKVKFFYTPSLMLHLLFNSFLVFAQFSSFYIGLNLTTSQRANIIFNTNPLLLLLLIHFFDKKDTLTLTKILAFLLAFGGVFLLFYSPQEQLWKITKGDLWIFFSAITIAISTFYTRFLLRRNIDSIALLFWQIFLTAIIVEFWIYYNRLGFSSWKNILSQWWLYLYFALLPNLLAPLMWFKVIKEYLLSSVSLFSFLAPPLISLFSYLILGEPVTLKIFISLVLISLSILLSELKNQNLPLETI